MLHSKEGLYMKKEAYVSQTYPRLPYLVRISTQL